METLQLNLKRTIDLKEAALLGQHPDSPSAKKSLLLTICGLKVEADRVTQLYQSETSKASLLQTQLNEAQTALQ